MKHPGMTNKVYNISNDVFNWSEDNFNRVSEIVKKYPNEIVGIKLAHFNGYNWLPVDRVVKAGKISNVPIMIDFGGSKPLMPLDSLLLNKLRPGDIFTHTYANVLGRMSIAHGQHFLEF